MAENSGKSEGNQPRKYFEEVKAAQKQAKPEEIEFINKLRADMVPTSDVQPAAERLLKRGTLRSIVGILLGLVVIALILYLIAGPGRYSLQNSLASLAKITVTPTFTATLTPNPPTKTPTAPASPTPTVATSLTPTVRVTRTPVIALVTAPTRGAPTSTSRWPTPSPTEVGCYDVLAISLADVGKTLCVQGKVIETIDSPNAFMVVFSNKPGAFYWVSYDMDWSKAKLKSCYQITGKIERLANSPVLVFNYHNIPEACP